VKQVVKQGVVFKKFGTINEVLVNDYLNGLL
jgi:hypothetical protein